MAYEEQLIKKFKANPKALYAYIKAKQKFKDTISYMVKEDGSTIENNKDIATAFGQFFQTTFSEENLDHIPELPVRTTSRLSEITTTEQLVLSKLLHLNSNKTPCPDKFYSCLLKNCAASLCKPVCCLFNQSLYTGELSADWINANVTPIHKKGLRSQASNYRPISLTSQAVKLLESTYFKRLYLCISY